MHLVRPPRHPALAPFVETVGYFAGEPPHARERILPSGFTDVMISLSDETIQTYDDAGQHRVTSAVVGGPRSGFTIIDTSPQRAIVCVHFRAGGAVPFLPIPVHALRDVHVPLADVWGSSGAVVRERLLEQPTPEAALACMERVLLDHVYEPLAADAAVEWAVVALQGGWRVRDVVAECGTTAKPFIRRFTERIGLPPKRFARIRRLQEMVTAIPASGSIDWARLAAEHGYCDQAHLIQDFRGLTGLRPTQYRPRSASEPNHVPL